jgi:hypothetical protein
MPQTLHCRPTSTPRSPRNLVLGLCPLALEPSHLKRRLAAQRRHAHLLRERHEPQVLVLLRRQHHLNTLRLLPHCPVIHPGWSLCNYITFSVKTSAYFRGIGTPSHPRQGSIRPHPRLRREPQALETLSVCARMRCAAWGASSARFACYATQLRAATLIGYIGTVDRYGSWARGHGVYTLCIL